MSGSTLGSLLLAAPPSATYLADLGLIVGVAAVCATLFQRLGLPIVLGYLLAGFLVGPSAPLGLAVEPGIAYGLSDLGVILLMFSLGLEFSLRRLVRTAPGGVLTALIECSLVTWLGYFAGRLLGWDATESIFVGAICAISSTTIIAKLFADKGIGGRLARGRLLGARRRGPHRHRLARRAHRDHRAAARCPRRCSARPRAGCSASWS